jgi:hypothetical protein
MGDGITLIDEPHIHTFYRCNCWHIRGGGIALWEAASGVLISGDLIPTAPSPDSYAGGPGACVLLDSLCS